MQSQTADRCAGSPFCCRRKGGRVMRWPQLWCRALVMTALCAWSLPALADEPKPSALPWLVGPAEAKLGDQALLKLRW